MRNRVLRGAVAATIAATAVLAFAGPVGFVRHGTVSVVRPDSSVHTLIDVARAATHRCPAISV